MSDGPLQDEWFRQTPPVPSDRPSSLPPSRLAGDPVWSAIAGALGGAIGSVAVILVGTYFAVPIALHVQPLHAALLGAAGVALGAGFGRVMRRLTRFVPRVVFGAVSAVALWLLVYAFVLVRMVPAAAAAIPFATSAVAALAYGACTGAVPPLRTRKERGRRL
jgi:hypothetical protein